MDDKEKRPGLAARVLRFPLTRIVLGAIFVIVPASLVQIPKVARHSAIVGIAVVLLACASYVAFVRLIEKRPVTELGARGAAVEAGVGLVIGALLFGCTMLVLWLLGVAHVGPGEGFAPLFAGLIASLAAAFSEELLMRGVLFRIVAASLGDWVALAISAVLFGALHAFNPGATLVSTVAIALEAGVLLAAAFMLTRRLWLPIGLHAAWNLTEGGLFGASVSGGSAHGLLSSRFTGPELLTGGPFGPEASIVAVVLCLTAGVILLVLARRRPGAARA